jgi:hypothetical protein
LLVSQDAIRKLDNLHLSTFGAFVGTILTGTDRNVIHVKGVTWLYLNFISKVFKFLEYISVRSLSGPVSLLIRVAVGYLNDVAAVPKAV